MPSAAVDRARCACRNEGRRRRRRTDQPRVGDRRRGRCRRGDVRCARDRRGRWAARQSRADRSDDDGDECGKRYGACGANATSPTAHEQASARLALGGADSALGLTSLGNADRVRRFARHPPREPTDQRETGGARALRHLRLSDQPRDVADESRALAFVGELVGARRTGATAPTRVDCFNREAIGIGSFARRRGHECR